MGKTSKIVLTERQEKYLVAHFGNTKNDELLEKLGVSNSTLHRFSRELGLTKTKQFMRQCQENMTAHATAHWKKIKMTDPEEYARQIEIRRNNLHWDDPAIRHSFKKGETNLMRLGEKRYKECVAKIAAKLAEYRRRNKVRVSAGLKPVNKLNYGQRNTKLWRRVAQVRSYLKKRFGYVVILHDTSRNVYYDENTRRMMKTEERYIKELGIVFLPVGGEKTVDKTVVVPTWDGNQLNTNWL